MPTLLLEIGCEELPAGACREAAEQLPALGERELGAPPTQVFVGPRRLALLFEDVAEQTPDEWIKGPPETLAEKAAAGFAKKHGVQVDDLVVRDGFLGVERPGQPLREVLPDRLDAIVRGLSFSKSMRWDDSGIRFARPVRWRLAKLDGETVVGETSFGHRFSHGALEIPSAGEYGDRLRAADVEPDAGERRRQIVDGLDAIGGWSDPAGVLEEVVYLVEKVLGARGQLRRALPAAPRARGRDRDAVAPALLPARREPLRLRRERWRPGTRARGQRERARGPARRRELHLRARRGARDRRACRATRGNHLLQGRRHVRRQDRAPTASSAAKLGGGEASLEAARLAKADQASELVREFPDLEGYIGAEYARLGRLPRGGQRCDRGAVPPGCRAGAAAANRGGEGARGGGQARHARDFVLARPQALRLSRPVRPAPGGDRAQPAGRRRRAGDPARHARG